VQSGFRGLTPPVDSDSALLIGLDGESLGAATLFPRAVADWSDVDFRGIAVAQHLRGRGGAHAREALDTALAEMQGRAHDAGASTQFVVARIDKRNGASRRLLAGAAFQPFDRDGDLELWSATFYVS
jgi:hypothetical protein